MNWFECKVSYETMTENGFLKKVTECYLVDALSFTEAEARIIAELTPYMHGEFTVSAVRKMNIAEVIAASGSTWYDCKVALNTQNEKTGTEKKTMIRIYVQGSCLENALKSLQEALKTSLADLKTVSISETQLMDIFIHAVN